MAYYYKINEAEDHLSTFKGLHHQKIKKSKESGPKINYDFSKHVLIELLDDSTPESKIWSELGLTNNKNVVHKRIMIDSHRIKCRRAIVVFVNSEEAQLLAKRLSQSMVMNRCVCAVVIQDLLSDLCLFEKQIMQFGDNLPQQQLLYVSDLNKCREPSGLVRFLKEKFSPFGTILSVLICPDDDGYAYPEGVIKFAYLSEAFAAELALDQYVVGKERLSVTTHHNILLSQCDLRVRLRNAQWCNNAEPYTLLESPFHSNELNLSTLDESPVINSIMNLHISSQNAKFSDKESTLNDLSVSHPKGYQCSANFHSSKSELKYLRKTNEDSIIHSSEKPISLSDCNKNINLNSTKSRVTGNSFQSNILPDVEVNNFSLIEPGDKAALRYTKSANGLFGDQFDHKRELNENIPEEDLTIISESDNFESCDPDSNAHSSYISAKMVSSNFHSVDLSAVSEYYSSSSVCKQTSSLENGNDSANKRKLARNNSKKRRKHFTPSQKLCLKSQRICLTQNAIESTPAKSEFSNSTTSVKSNKITCKNNLNFYKATPEGLPSMPEDAASLKVTNWLAHLPSSQNNGNIEQNVKKQVTSVRSLTSRKKQKNRISIHNTPSLKFKTTWGSGNGTDSNTSSIENEDPDDKTVLLSKKDIAAFQNDKSHTPLQAWLKQELVFATNNSVIKSQETMKSVIVCAAKTKDVIISVGCSHMTCDFCYPQSTDLLLGYS